jgi:hypothetical protein
VDDTPALPVDDSVTETQEVPPSSVTEPARPIDLTDEEKAELRNVFTTITRPDDDVREKMVPIWQKYEYYWRGLQDVVYDKTAKEYRSADGVIRAAGELEDDYIGTKFVNLYQSHGTSIAAALSAETPKVKFFPEDAEDPQDITTAKTYSTAAEFIADDNDARLLLLRAIYTRWNQSFVAYYNTYVYDDKFGSIEKKTYRTREVERIETVCPECGEDVPVQGPNSMCEVCRVPAIQTPTIDLVPEIAEIITIPKGREKIEVYGPRHVRVPYNIKNVQQAGYLILEGEFHWAMLADLFPHAGITSGYSGSLSPEGTARDARKASEGGESDSDQRTLLRCWFRPWTFNLIEDEAIRAELKVKFPHGIQVTYIDDIFVEAFDESMDDHWTIDMDPFAEHIHGDPLGKPMIPIQDMHTDVTQLTLDTILSGIPDRFADPTVLNFKSYKESERAPGGVFPAKRPAGMGLDSGFWESRAVTLSENVDYFTSRLESYGEQMTGDRAGISGGSLPKGSSRTAGEYQQAKQSALQRLSVVWYCLSLTWSQVMKKAVQELRVNMRYQGQDIKFVKEAGEGFANVWIKLADIDDGNVGRVRAENSETFPMSTPEKRAMIMELLQTGIPPLFQWLFDSENLGEMSRIMFGLTNFKIPGEEDREQQLWEISNILRGQMEIADPDLDNHEIHSKTIRSWASGYSGHKVRDINPVGYGMVMEHLQQHEMILQQRMLAQQAMAAPPPQPSGAVPPGKKDTGNAPVSKPAKPPMGQ